MNQEWLNITLQASMNWCGITPVSHKDWNEKIFLGLQELFREGLTVPMFLLSDLQNLMDKENSVDGINWENYETNGDLRLALKRRYQQDFLLRLQQIPALRELLQLFRISPHHSEQKKALIQLLLHRFSRYFPETFKVPVQAMLSRMIWSEPGVPEHESRLEELTGITGFWEQWIESFLNTLSTGIHWSSLLQEEDLFELLHWHALSTEHLKMGCKGILQVERLLGSFALETIHVPEEGHDAETMFVDETWYPTGGVVELTHHGSFENLVSSELVFLEEGEALNLFDLRYVENDLLYFHRDEGVLRRKRRTLHLVYDLAEVMNIKSRGYDVQFSMLLQGLGLRLIMDLRQIFERDSVHFHFHFFSTPDLTEMVNREMRLLEVLLRDAVAQHTVFFHLNDPLQESFSISDRKTYALVFADQNFQRWDFLKEPEVLSGKALLVPLLRGSDPLRKRFQYCILQEGMTWPQLRQLRNDILYELVGGIHPFKNTGN
ncbi:MAG: hypothetical protein HQM12_20380 [SAR324 cluster bacterium]|nr:hypothetical protein [SAR324 cluster bacterium]